jgi:hypothetical protein
MEQYIKPAVWVISTPEDLMETTLPKGSPQPGGGEDPSHAEGKETTIFEEVELPAQENIWGDEE